jgi:hypothetical protein
MNAIKEHGHVLKAFFELSKPLNLSVDNNVPRERVVEEY